MTSTDWTDFLASLPTMETTAKSQGNFLYPIDYLGILTVSGQDATSFLQGQLTADMVHLSLERSYFTALCNAKGRVISTLLIVKRDSQWVLILPKILLNPVKQILSRYILRAKVQLMCEESLIISGMQMTYPIAEDMDLPENEFNVHHAAIKLPSNRYLLIDSVKNTVNQWQLWLNKGFVIQQSEAWELLDIMNKMAWLNLQSSELYIPQMLNIDQFGGISFTKGCYIGQEIVARIHYLGTVKRQLSVIKSNGDNSVELQTKLDSEGGQLLPLMNSINQPYRLAVVPVSVIADQR